MRWRFALAGIGLLVGVTTGVVAARTPAEAPHPAAPAHPQPAAPADPQPAVPHFPDFGHMPPPDVFHPDRTFRLAQDYPATLPPIEPAVARILGIDFTRDWRGYARAVFDYAMAGNTGHGGTSNDFFLEDNRARRWYHVPWQHWGEFGREGLHGLTREGPLVAGTLGVRHRHTFQSYAVGFYNGRGGYTIGRVWANPEHPDLDAVAGRGFPVGTVVAKLLFTDGTPDELPFLSNSLDWVAYIADIKPELPQPAASPAPPSFAISPSAPARRTLATVRLIQMDFMVRDDRALATGGWVYGTYAYNGAVANPDKWRNLVPVGIMWGNDPTVLSHQDGNFKPVTTLTNPDLRHTTINAADPQLPPMHLGFGLRLSGPIDNTLSSCQSCHQTAQYPAVSFLLPYMNRSDGSHAVCGDAAWMRWFRDIRPGQPFDAVARSTDGSMQLAGSIANFVAAKDIATGGFYAGQFFAGRPVNTVYAQRGAQPDPGSGCGTQGGR